MIAEQAARPSVDVPWIKGGTGNTRAQPGAKGDGLVRIVWYDLDIQKSVGGRYANI